MASKLDLKIQDYLDLVIGQAKKEIKYIEGKDWADISALKVRESEYDLQALLNHRNINALIKLHGLAKEDLKHPTVKNAMALLMKFYNTLDARYSKMEKKFDWTTVFEGEEDEETKKRAEIEFQSGVLGDLTKHKENLRKINFGEESNEVNIVMHSETPMPFMMRESMEERYPEVLEHMEHKMNEENQEED